MAIVLIFLTHIVFLVPTWHMMWKPLHWQVLDTNSIIAFQWERKAKKITLWNSSIKWRKDRLWQCTVFLFKKHSCFTIVAQMPFFMVISHIKWTDSYHFKKKKGHFGRSADFDQLLDLLKKYWGEFSLFFIFE